MATLLTHNDDRQVLTASSVEVEQARDVVERLPDDREARPSLESPAGRSMPMPPELSRMITQILEIVSSGGTVTVGAMPEQLTTTAAANVLGVSRPTLMKMIERGEIEAEKVGSHSRLRASEVLALRARRRTKQRQAFDALRALEDD